LQILVLDQYADVICHDSGHWYCRRRCCRRRVHAKLDEGAKSAKATLSAMSEIRSNYLDYTCNVSGIYSCIFFSGPAGVFYQQFAVTLAIAILISAVNALTLSPALCALLLKPHTDSKHRNANFKDFHCFQYKF
jgi:HAE1 family hydrophobic/amphiphilic exporter-1